MNWRLIRPDPPEGGELPASEFVHPLPIAALVTLAVNDHLLKGSGLLPGIVTGKLSDFAGLFFFPLLVTACGDCLLHGINRISGRHLIDASLNRPKLVAAGLFTALLFTSIKLSAAAADAYAAIITRFDLFGLWSRVQIVQDHTDLISLPMIALAVYFGWTRIAEIPPGRLAALAARKGPGHKKGPEIARRLEDCRRAAGQPHQALAVLTGKLSPWLTSVAAGDPDEAARRSAARALAAWRAGTILTDQTN